MLHSLAAYSALLGLFGLRLAGPGPHVGPAPPETLAPEQIAEFWIDPADIEAQDLYNGP